MLQHRSHDDKAALIRCLIRGKAGADCCHLGEAEMTLLGSHVYLPHEPSDRDSVDDTNRRNI